MYNEILATTAAIFLITSVVSGVCSQECRVCLPADHCEYCPGHWGCGDQIDPSVNELIFELVSMQGVSSGPTEPSSFTLDTERTITAISTYHWPGVPPGTIGLIKDDGTTYGPWPASGCPGMGGAANAYWIVKPNVRLPSGTYSIVDSDKSTWSYTPGDCTGPRGHCFVFALKDNQESAGGDRYTGVATSTRSGRDYPFILTLIPKADGSIGGQIEWTGLGSIHQIEGSKTTTGITFAETAYIKQGGAVLNCKYYLNSAGSNSFTGTWDSCDDGDYGEITVNPL